MFSIDNSKIHNSFVVLYAQIYLFVEAIHVDALHCDGGIAKIIVKALGEQDETMKAEEEEEPDVPEHDSWKNKGPAIFHMSDAYWWELMEGGMWWHLGEGWWKAPDGAHWSPAQIARWHELEALNRELTWKQCQVIEEEFKKPVPPFKAGMAC